LQCLRLGPEAFSHERGGGGVSPPFLFGLFWSYHKHIWYQKQWKYIYRYRWFFINWIRHFDGRSILYIYISPILSTIFPWTNFSLTVYSLTFPNCVYASEVRIYFRQVFQHLLIVYRISAESYALLYFLRPWWLLMTATHKTISV